MNIEHPTSNIERRRMNSVSLKKSEQACLANLATQAKGELTVRCNSEQYSGFCFFKKEKAQRNQYWTFDVERSMFDVQSVL